MDIARRVFGFSLVVLVSACGVGHPLTDGPVGVEVSSPDAGTSSDPRFAPQLIDAKPTLVVPGSLRGQYDEGGALIAFSHDTTSAPSVTIKLTAFGRLGTLRELPAPRASIEDAEVRLRRDALPSTFEWWRSLPSGLEHGLTITERPPGQGALILDIAIEGELHVRALSDDSVALVNREARVVGRYGSLVVLDADGTPITAKMSLHEERVRIEIDDETARYPLIVDPLLTALEAALIPADRSALDYFGHSVSLNGNGTRAIVGALYDGTALGYDAGSVRVYTRSGATWTLEQMLLAADAQDEDQLGSAVSLSADGTRALVGASGDYTAGVRTGSARVFVRSGSTWTEEQTLVPSGGGAEERFGAAASISADGTRAIVGAYWADTAGGVNAGSARVFLRTGNVWALEQTLVAAGGAADEWFGYSVAMNGDGSRAIVGVPYDDGGGSARVFIRVGTTWTEQATLRGSNIVGGDYFGRAVTIDNTGTRALIGAWADDVGGRVDAGSARVFVRSGSSWSEEASLFASNSDSGDYFGWAVSLSSDGTRAIVGADGDDTAAGLAAGSARIFSRSGSVWTEEPMLTATNGAANDFFGAAVALSGDGIRAIVGAYGDDMGAGSAHVFTLLSVGGTCSTAAECASGFCVDGRCCNSACGGGVTDCQACSVAAGGTLNGTCTPLVAAAAAGVTCRPSAGACDVAETCTSTSMACPSNAFAASTITCRPSGGPCDVAETCTGAAAACPINAFRPSSTTCRPAAGICDAPESCTGASAACPADAFRPASTTCRPAAGICDAPESCTGASAACPADAFLPPSTACRPAAGICDTPESCTGSSVDCPTDTFEPAGHECAPATGGECDAPDVCPGDSATCVATFAPRDTICGPDAADACDAPDHCEGSSDTCVPEVAAMGVPCRVSSDPFCDPEEQCDGVTSMCPDDIDECIADAGTREDGGTELDGAVPQDAGTISVDAAANDAGDAAQGDASLTLDAGPPSSAEGCTCRVTSSSSRPPAALLLFALGFFARRRRRW